MKWRLPWKWQVNRNHFCRCQCQLNIFVRMIMNAKAKYLSQKMKYLSKISSWMKHDILKSIKDQDDIYKTLKTTPQEGPTYDSWKKHLQKFKPFLKNEIRFAKTRYYADIIKKNESNIRHTWAAIKEILGKFKDKHGFSDYSTRDRKLIRESQLITPCEKISYKGTDFLSSYLKCHPW